MGIRFFVSNENFKIILGIKNPYILSRKYLKNNWIQLQVIHISISLVYSRALELQSFNTTPSRILVTLYSVGIEEYSKSRV